MSAKPPSTEMVKASVELAPLQQQAIESLITGKSIAETALAAGVTRATVHRWMREDPVFQAAYNQWQDQVQETCRTRLLMLTAKATAAVEKSLEAGDAKTALQLLKSMNMLSQRPLGPTDAEDIRKDIELTRKKRKHEISREEHFIRDQMESFH